MSGGLILFYTTDTNKNGTIDKKDFDMALEQVGKVRKLQAGSGKMSELKQHLDHVWETLKKQADRDNDGNVSEQEWLKMWEEAINEKQDPAWVKRYQQFLFEVSSHLVNSERHNCNLWSFQQLKVLRNSDCFGNILHTDSDGLRSAQEGGGPVKLVQIYTLS